MSIINNMYNIKLIISYMIVIDIVISGYIVPGTNFSLGILFAFIMAFIIFVYNLITNCKQPILISKTLLMLLLYVFISQLFLTLHQDNTVIIKNLLVVILTTFTVFVISSYLNEQSFFRAYKMIALVCMMGLFYQSIQVYILKLQIQSILILPRIFVPGNNWAALAARPMSFFQEPQAYAVFMMPLLIYSVNKKEYIFSFLLSLSILLSTSSTGIIITGFVWVYYSVFIIRSNYKKISLLILIAILALLFINSELFAYSVDKIVNINISTNQRLVNGFDIIRDMSTSNLIIGIGMGTLSSFLYDNYLYYAPYTSTISGCIINYGTIGLGFYLFMLYKFYIGQGYNVKLFVILILLLSFTQTILFNAAFEYFYISYFICAEKRVDDYIKLNFSSIKAID